jgi:hypothetical protein
MTGVLILFALIFGVVILGHTTKAKWADTLTSQSNKLETWASQSYLRMFGMPFLAAAVICALAKLTGSFDAVRHLFAYGFVGFIIFSLFLTGAGVAHVRLSIKLSFMTVLFGAIISLLLP